MCFSAEASFAASGVLVPAGGFCLWSALRKQPRYLPLAAIPLFFGVQQASEGVVWLALGKGDTELVRPAALIFLFFAVAFWPMWIPLQAAVAEPIPWRRWLLAALAAVNTLWFWYLFWPLAVGPASLLQVEMVHHSISYQFSELNVYQYVPLIWLRLLYVLSVALPFVVASRSLGLWPGIVIGASAVVAVVAFEYAFVSVWCFFAAILSVWICTVFYSMPVSRLSLRERAF
jgi:hypothetical protein